MTPKLHPRYEIHRHQFLFSCTDNEGNFRLPAAYIDALDKRMFPYLHQNWCAGEDPYLPCYQVSRDFITKVVDALVRLWLATDEEVPTRSTGWKRSMAVRKWRSSSMYFATAIGMESLILLFTSASSRQCSIGLRLLEAVANFIRGNIFLISKNLVNKAWRDKRWSFSVSHFVSNITRNMNLNSRINVRPSLGVARALEHPAKNMLISIVTCLISLLLLLRNSSIGAVVFSSFTYNVRSEGIVMFDLDGDSTTDLLLDLNNQNWTTSNTPYLLTTLGSTRVVASGGITTSFSVGDIVTIINLPLVGSQQPLQTGGVVTDCLGNFLCEGWGGVEYNDLGNPQLPLGGPEHQIDLFLVQLRDGVAWVDLDNRNINWGEITANWGYLSPAEDTFTISNVPEPTSSTLLMLTGCFALFSRNRQSRTIKGVAKADFGSVCLYL